VARVVEDAEEAALQLLIDRPRLRLSIEKTAPPRRVGGLRDGQRPGYCCGVARVSRVGHETPICKIVGNPHSGTLARPSSESSPPGPGRGWPKGLAGGVRPTLPMVIGGQTSDLDHDLVNRLGEAR
jgi:hypothetical protein